MNGTKSIVLRTFALWVSHSPYVRRFGKREEEGVGVGTEGGRVGGRGESGFHGPTRTRTGVTPVARAPHIVSRGHGRLSL